MPPFRLAVRHPDAKHHDHGWAHVGPVFDDPEEITEFVEEAQAVDTTELESVNQSLPPEQRVRKRDRDTLAELLLLGYEYKPVELVVKREEPDDAGTPRPVEHRLKEVRVEEQK